MTGRIGKLISFVTDDIWRIRLRDLSRGRLLLVKQVRTFILALRRFREEQSQLSASALTFYTLLAVVPIVAMAFGIAKGFGLEEAMEKMLTQKLQGQEEAVRRIMGFAHSLLENTRGGLIAGMGVLLLFWTVIQVLGNIENSFNAIWGVRQGRSLGRKFSDYLTLMLVCPILLIASGSLTVALSTKVNVLLQKIPFVAELGVVTVLVLKLVPYFILWSLFSLIYIVMPNTRVNWGAGVLAGVVAGTAIQVLQWAYLKFQVGVASYNAVYGTFAALPLFLAWMQMSWRVTLFGAQVSFAWQNQETYEFESDCLKVNYAFRRLLSLRVMQDIIARFRDGKPPRTTEEISRDLDLPVRLARQIVFELAEAGLVSGTAAHGAEEAAYQPSHDLEGYSIESVIAAMEHHGTENIPVARTPELERLAASLEERRRGLSASPANLLLKEI